MKKYVFSCAIIPVQEYISEATRSRDLKIGSSILSWMMANVLTELLKLDGLEIVLPLPQDNMPFSKRAETVFPTGEKIETAYSIPNKATGFLQTEKPEDLKDRFISIEKMIHSELWEKLVGNAFTKNSEKRSDDLNQFIEYLRSGVNEKTIECPFQLIWVWQPASTEPFDEADEIKKIGHLFDQIKLARPIQPWIAGGPVPKCSQCGKREIIGPIDSYSEWRTWFKTLRDGSQTAVFIDNGYRWGKKDQLCAWCWAKRMAAYDFLPYGKTTGHFPSTGEIAVRKWIERFQDAEAQTIYENFLKDGNEDILGEKPALLYSGKRKSQSDFVEKKITEVRDDFKCRIKVYKESNKKFPHYPSTYLSLISFDGDHVGQLINTNPRRTAECLKQLVDEQQKIVGDAKYAATPIFLGGDEGILLCPLETAIELVFNIQNDFTKIFKANLNEKVTLTAAVLFFDYQRPLGAALRQVREMLRQGKNFGRDALHVGVQTASANQWTFLSPWEINWPRSKKWLELLRKDEIPNTWPYEIETALNRFELIKDFSKKDFSEIAEIVRTEMKRITHRKWIKKDSEGSDDFIRDYWPKFDPNGWLEDLKQINQCRSYANLFHLLAFLDRESLPLS